MDPAEPAEPAESAEFAGALALLGAFVAAGVSVDDYTARIQERVEAEHGGEAPTVARLHRAAATALETAEAGAVTVAEYTAVIKQKEPSATPHPASKRQCVRSVNQAPS